MGHGSEAASGKKQKSPAMRRPSRRRVTKIQAAALEIYGFGNSGMAFVAYAVRQVPGSNADLRRSLAQIKAAFVGVCKSAAPLLPKPPEEPGQKEL